MCFARFANSFIVTAPREPHDTQPVPVPPEQLARAPTQLEAFTNNISLIKCVHNQYYNTRKDLKCGFASVFA